MSSSFFFLTRANGKTVQWDATHQSSNPGARTFSWIPEFSKIYQRYT
jgi:hypothetical protein